MEKRTAGNDRSEAVLRWVAAGMALAFFGGVAACAGEEAGAEVGDVAFGEVGQAMPVEVETARESAAPLATTHPQPAPPKDPTRPDTVDTDGPVADEGPAPEAGGETLTPWEHYDLGISAWQRGDPAVAEEHLREWALHAPDHVKGRVNLARALIETGRPREAREHATMAANLDPASAPAKRVLARALAESGDRSAALAMYEEALWLDPEDRWSLNNMGYLLILRGSHDEAMGPLALAVELDSANAMFRANLGAALEWAGHGAAALHAYETAAALDPAHSRAAASAARLRGLLNEDVAGEVDIARLARDFRRELLGTGEREPPGRYECPW